MIDFSSFLFGMAIGMIVEAFLVVIGDKWRSR